MKIIYAEPDVSTLMDLSEKPGVYPSDSRIHKCV